MKEKICAYCSRKFGEDGCNKTAEHIFPQGLIALYPEQDISSSKGKVFIDNSGLTIKDVCNICNNEILSMLDNYGCKLIVTKFCELIKYEDRDRVVECELNFDLLSRWLLKIALWSKDKVRSEASIYNRLMIEKFSFNLLNQKKDVYKLKRVSASTNFTMGYTHLLSTPALKQDEMVTVHMLHGQDPGEVREKLRNSKSEEECVRSNLLIKSSIFPDNKKLQQMCDRAFNAPTV